MTRRTVAAVLAATLTAWFFATVSTEQARPKRVLFIGNSYTYFNNLPDILRGLAVAASLGAVDVRMVANGGWRLKDHWERGDARRLLRERSWDDVVLQDQSTLGVNHYVEGVPRVTTDEAFRPYAKLWGEEIRGAGAVPVFYVTWARKATPEDQAALNSAYISAANASHAVVAPVGQAWKAIREQYPSLELFQNDGSHPSSAGSYLAACTLLAALFDRSQLAYPPASPDRRLTLRRKEWRPTRRWCSLTCHATPPPLFNTRPGQRGKRWRMQAGPLRCPPFQFQTPFPFNRGND